MIRTKHRRWLGALVLAALLSGQPAAAEQADAGVVETEDVAQATATSSAAEADPPKSEAEDAPDAAAGSDAGTGTAAADDPPAARNGPSPDVFVPTEEISEDFAVSFPVDI
jgi:hypothetical protein